MRIFKKILLYSFIVVLILSSIPVHEKALAASTCPGISMLTDPLAIRMEKGETVIWENVNPSLITAKVKYEQLIKAKGWRITYESAYRPYQYQRHFYEIVHAPASACKNAEMRKHGLTGLVAMPSPNAPHVKGAAFDAIVYDKSNRALNGKSFVNSSLAAVAKQAGLGFPHPTNDGVHHELVAPPPPPSPVEISYKAKGKITAPSGFNVRNLPNAGAARIGGVYKNDIVEITAKAGDWYKIKFGTGYGYIMAVQSGLEVINGGTTPQLTVKVGTITNASGLNVRSGPSTNYARIGGVYQNDRVEIVGQTGDWYKIKFNGSYGYINNLGVQIGTTPLPTKTGVITNASGLSVRSGPSTNYARIGGVYQNDRVEIVGQTGDWYKIKFNGGYGYINNLGVQIGTTTPSLPGSTVSYNVSVSYQRALDVQMSKNPQISNGGRWVTASRSEVDTYMNPQKIINNPVQKYQFLDISQYEGVSEVDIANYLKDKGVLAGKASIFMKAARDFKINPIYLVAHASLETGNGRSDLARGYVSKIGYTKGKKVYNVYGYGANDGAVRNGIDYAVENGAKYAYNAGWFTLDQAIYKGAQTISKYHFNGPYNQSTLYENRWNPKSPGVNQYATDVRWAYNQAADLKKMFDKFPNAKLVFKVPVYK